MDEAAATGVAEGVAVRCPSCGMPLPATAETLVGRQVCGSCGKACYAGAFDPPPAVEVGQPVPVGPDDVACANHPNFAARHVCAGSGTYICDLCAVTLDGEVLAVQYLDGAGKQKLDRRAATSLKRPDRLVTGMMAVSLLVFFPIWWLLTPVVWWQVAVHRRMLRENADYAEVVPRGSSGRIVVAAVVQTVLALLSIGLYAFLATL